MTFHSMVNKMMASLLTILVIYSLAHADTFDNLHLLKISPQDERAVVKMEDGAMKIIKPGDATGRSFSNALKEQNNLNMKDNYVRQTNNVSQWPKVRGGSWLHSDIKAVSYPYLNGLFHAFVVEGERK